MRAATVSRLTISGLMADLITHQFDGHPFAGRHGIGEVAEFEARYYEQAVVAWIVGRFILAESPR